MRLSALLLLSLLVPACTTSSRRGDFTLRDYRHDKLSGLFFPTVDYIYYGVRSQRVSIDHAATHTLRVRGFPTDAVFQYCLVSQEPAPPDDYYIDHRKVPWMRAVLRLRAVTIQGRCVYDKRTRVGDIGWGFFFTQPTPRPAESATLKEFSRAVRGLSDFDVVFDVETPSARAGDFLLLKASGEALPDGRKKA